jgi:hypothetical protein
MTTIRAFSGKVEAGFPKENATNYESADRFPINLIGKRSTAPVPQ